MTLHRDKTPGSSGIIHKSKSPMTLWAVLFWLVIWQIAGMIINDNIFFVTPLEVLQRLSQLVFQGSFWLSIGYSFTRIIAGFFLAAAIGTLMAILSSRSKQVESLLAPLILVIKSVPVVSFIILALIIFTSRNLSILISFMMGLPVFYSNVLQGIRSMDPKLDEMATVFRIPDPLRLRDIAMPQIYPYFEAAVSTAAGLCWKAGAAAEVIGIPDGSIGEYLQRAKVYLETADLFAWTIVIVICSLLLEKLSLLAAKRAATALERIPESQTDGANSEHTDSNDIKVNDLVKTYGTLKVLNDFNAVIQNGRVTAVMAPSGVGKTTLLRILTGLEAPDSGHVSGMENRKISYVFQEDRLLESFDAVTNVRIVRPELSDEEVKTALAAVGLRENACIINEYSGGMKRRVAIVRALMADWDVLFMDEPFRGLDEISRKLAIDYTSQLLKGRTCVLVTHDPDEPQLMGAESIITLKV